MIFEVIIYFFIVFGIMQFSTCIWELFSHSRVTKSAFVVLKISHGSEYCLSDIVCALKKYPFSIFAVCDNEELYRKEAEILERSCENFELISSKTLLEKLSC